MGIKQISDLHDECLKALNDAGLTLQQMGERRRISMEVKSLAVSAALSGIANAKIVNALKKYPGQPFNGGGCNQRLITACIDYAAQNVGKKEKE